METTQIGVRLGNDLLRQIDSLVPQLGRNRTEVVIALLEKGLEQPLDTVEQRLTTVESRLAAVEQRLTVSAKNKSSEDALEGTKERSVIRSYLTEYSKARDEWQTMADVGRSFGFNAKNAGRDAKARGETILEFLQRKTELVWESSGGDRPLFRRLSGNQ